MSRSLPKKNNPLILADAAPHYDELLARRRLGKTNLSVKPGQIGTSNATQPENLGVFEYAHLRAPLPKELKGSEIFPSHSAQQHPETYFLMRRSKDGFVSATGMFKIAFPWAKAEEERTEREYLKSREYTSQDEIAGNVWISPLFALELSKEYKMYDWVRALLDPADIVQSPTSAKKHITPPPKFELPSDEPTPSQQQRRSRRSVSPSKKSSSPRKSRQARPTKDVLSTPSTAAANNSLQEALEVTASAVDAEYTNGVLETVEETEVKTSGSPEKKKGRKPKKAAAEAEEEKKEETKEDKKEDKKAEKKKKKEAKEKETEVEITASADTTDPVKTTQTTVSLDMPITLPEVPSAAETEDMIAKAKEMVEDAIKNQQADGTAAGSSSAKVIMKRKAVEDDDEETSAEAAQRAKKAKVLEDKLKRERVRNRALVGVSAAFALAASIPYFF